MTSEESSIELSDFLNEMISVIKHRLDEQQSAINDLMDRINTLESKGIKSMIDKRFKEYNGSIDEVKDRLAILEKNGGVGWAKINKEIINGLR